MSQQRNGISKNKIHALMYRRLTCRAPTETTCCYKNKKNWNAEINLPDVKICDLINTCRFFCLFINARLYERFRKE